jgi:hypothetical protein
VITEYLLKKPPLTIGLMTMTGKRRLLVVITLAAAVVLFSFTSACMKIGFSDSASGKIDLFTQKEPFSGKGLNMPSDAFSPGEVVILHALVEWNEYPRQNLMVTFSVRSPDGSSFSLVSLTDASGIASVNFTIPQKCPPYENETFGEWFSMATVVLGDYILQDTLTFKVGWVVELLAVKTIDGNLSLRKFFGITGDVGLEISLKSIAMIEKNSTLAIVIQDELDVPVSFLEIENFEVPPNEKTVFLYCKLNIPKWAHVGKAKVFVSALTAPPSKNGVAYCPSISTEFFITIFEPLKMEFHDVAIIKVVPSTPLTKIGERVFVNIKVRNEGTTFESFNVSLCLNDYVIATFNVLSLAPYSSVNLRLDINTSNMKTGNYLISAFIPPVLNEADYTDNNFVDGYIEIRPAVTRFLVIFEQMGLSADADGIVLKLNGSAKTIHDLPLSLWVEEGSTLTYSYEETVSSTVSGKRFKLINVTGPTSPIIVKSNITIIGKYKIQYYLTVSSPYGSPIPSSEWFDAGTRINASIISPWPGPEGIRYMCLGWTGTGSVPPSGTSLTVTFTIYQPSSIIWNWKTQYFLTVVSPYGVVGGGGWYDANETAYAYLDVSVVDHGNGTRRVFAFWSGDASGTNYAKSGPILMDGPKTAVANWKTQYLLTVFTDPADLRPQPSRNPLGDAGPAGGWWYDAYVNVFLSAPPVKGYDFSHWDVDGVAVEAGVYQLTVYMDGPHRATAHYRGRVAGWFIPEWFYWILLLILALIIALLCILIYRRRKKAKAGESAFRRGWTAWYYGYDLRGKTRRF